MRVDLSSLGAAKSLNYELAAIETRAEYCDVTDYRKAQKTTTKERIETTTKASMGYRCHYALRIVSVFGSSPGCA